MTTPSRPLLSVADLVVRFRTHEGTIHAVNGVTFDLEEGERLGLVGESGCGKSVTNLAMMRLLPKPAGRIEGGQVTFDGLELTAIAEDEMRSLRGRDIAMIFQDPMTSLNPVLTIEEQMVETIQAHRSLDRAQAVRRAVELLSLVGIPEPEDRLSSFPHQFSGGMRQRVMIAMALALEPKLLIADEPTTALDVTIQAQVLELIRGLTEDFGTALILITHDLGVVAGMTNRINVMYAGYIVESATTNALFGEPSHPYTVGLLHSIPRLDMAEGEALIPIEGRPPDMRHEPTACPFAPRCRWRLDVCWTQNPALRPVDDTSRVVLTGAEATHRIACFNPVTLEERAAGRPLRPGFQLAPAPPGAVDEVAAEGPGSTADLEGLIEGIESEEGQISTGPSAAGLPLPVEREHRSDGIFRDDR
jgi:oligopeptide transport system ATP-binding protein